MPKTKRASVQRFMTTREDLEMINEALIDGLVALLDEETILERGHFGNKDHRNAVASMKAALSRIRRLKKRAKS